MSLMFAYATAFNQNLGNWLISHLTSAANMLHETKISQNNYDALLEGWWSGKSAAFQPDVSFTGTGLNPSTTDAKSVKENLIKVYGWEIS